jgi:large repetitive protein
VSWPLDTVIATFTDTNPAPIGNPSLISAVVNWGDGQTSQGAVNLVSSTGTYTVTGSYTYPTADPSGTFSVTVTITDPSGQSSIANSVAYVVSTITNGNPFNFSGGLALVPGNGPYTSKGYTNTNQPAFSGTAAPFSIVQLYARPFGIDTQLPLGEAVTNGSSQWSLATGPLLPGTYTISVVVTPSGGSPTAMISLNNNGLVHIDMVPKSSKAKVHHQIVLAHQKISKPPKLAHRRLISPKHRSI